MLGAALVKTLVAQGVAVIAVIRPDNARRSNLPEHKLLHVIECDACDYHRITPDTLERIAAQTPAMRHFAPPLDVCYHFAWSGTDLETRDDLHVQIMNIDHALDAMEMARRLGCSRFVGAGSQAEYGTVPYGQRLTASTPANPVTCYGIAKLAAGLFCRQAAKQAGMAVNWVRITSVYGPMDKEYTLVISSIRKFLRGEHVGFTKGEQIWDYLYSEDAAQALYLIGLRGKPDIPYVLGSGEPLRLADCIASLAAAVDQHADYALGELPYRNAQVTYLCADISELTNDTGFTPSISFAEGIRRTIAWCRLTM